MKTFIFSALALGMMASCTNTEVEGVIDNGEPVAIRLSAGVEATTVLSRAAINDNDKFKATVLGWEGNDITDYGVKPTWAAVTSDIQVSATETSGITLTESQYYKADGTKTYMKAFYVDGETPIAATDNEWIYNLSKRDGSIDILLADAVGGDRNTPAGAFLFKHPLTKLIFKAVAGDGLADNTTLKSIKVKGMSVPEKINLGTSKVEYGTALTESLLIGGIESPQTITSTATEAGNPIMVKPITGEFYIEVETSIKTYENVKVILDAVADHADGAGVAYVITLTFKDQISASASVAAWTAGTGQGTVG